MTTQPSPQPAESKFSINSMKTYYKLNPWKSRILLILLSLIIILGIVRLTLPHAIIYSATSWLKERNIDATIEAININIFDGTVSLVNAKGSQDGESLFNVGLIDIHWRWAPLSEKTAVVTKVVLDNFAANIEQYSDAIIIGGVHVPLNGTTDEKQDETEVEAEDIKPWAASLGEVVFTNLNVCYLQNTSTLETAGKETLYIDYCVNLDEMTWGGTISYGTDPALLGTDDIALSSTGHFKLNGLTVTDNKLDKQLLRSSSNTLSNVVISGLNDIHIDTLEMNGLSALQRDDKEHEDAVRFKQLTVRDISLSKLNSLKINSLSLEDTGLYIVRLNQEDWEYAQWIPQAPAAAEKNTAGEQQETGSSGFSFAINNIQVDDSDFCYLENSNNIYYCFNQDSLDWKGSITTSAKPDGTAISMAGDLNAVNTKIHNPGLKRDLLDIKSISLNKLKVTDIDKASFEALTIDSLSALQRGEKTSDNTASFTRLTINKVDYMANAITIDAINLTGLSSLVSKNKDGSWEYDKWLSNEAEKPAADDSDDAPAEKPSDLGKPLLVSVKSVVIKTQKDLLFVDNSTKPSMEVGLKKFDFSIKNLNSSKPKSDSPFKFFGKTTRHSTIDLAGTVRPYAEKVSFDAKGKLKGFDLRAATPATKKAIGHIIKSGQLDADLELLAVDGQLDSNIGLSLYKFHIKPMSKEDAKKLDTELGMPLNQTLVLLRDKDDSIHLDIPITGDINNPDFSPMHAIVKATTKAATVTLITFYTPYGLIYAGSNALFDLATAMNFDPVPFAAGSAKLPADGEKQLDNLGKLLTEKPQVHLTLCGMTNRGDVFALYPALKKPVEKNKAETATTEKASAKKDVAETAPVLSQEQNIALKKLATDRQIASKNYLIKTANITHDRLILCEPEPQTEDKAIAGVEVNI